MADVGDLAQRILPMLQAGALTTKAQLHHAKQSLARDLGLETLPTDRELGVALGPASARTWPILRTKPTRSMSGVAVVAVMSSPASCPHGKCTFCPGGPEVNAPQSYTGFEPSTLRARRHNYDSYAIVRDRLTQLQGNGHAIDKVDIVIQGGTFPAREPAYRDWFVAGIYAGLNAGPNAGLNAGPNAKAADAGTVATASTHDSPNGHDLPIGHDSEGDWAALGAEERARRLAILMQANESARCRAIGLTIETKPDWCFEPHIDEMLRYGATRVEIGLQTLDEGVLKATHRGHTLDDSRKAMRIARDAGFKICAHLMPGLPRQRGNSSGVPPTSGPGYLDPDPAADIEDFRRLFAEADWRPDMLKVYPTLVVMEGETLLKRQWQRGEFHPLDTAGAMRVVVAGKSFVPEWCRIQRIDRDIPTTHVEAGVMNSNLRQMALEERRRQGLPSCRCIRCRETARRGAEGHVTDPSRLVIVRREYEASGGQECFISLEDPLADAIVAFVRVRHVGPRAHRSETQAPGGSAFVRELKVYGIAKPVGDDDPEDGSWQHQGHGAHLLQMAEEVAFGEWGVGRVLVIAGVGVKAYYRRHGYKDLGAYVAKELAAWTETVSAVATRA